MIELISHPANERGDHRLLKIGKDFVLGAKRAALANPCTHARPSTSADLALAFLREKYVM